MSGHNIIKIREKMNEQKEAKKDIEKIDTYSFSQNPKQQMPGMVSNLLSTNNTMSTALISMMTFFLPFTLGVILMFLIVITEVGGRSLFTSSKLFLDVFVQNYSFIGLWTIGYFIMSILIPMFFMIFVTISSRK